MELIFISFIFISVTIGLIATFVSGLIKLIFFLRRKEAFVCLLKFGIIGELVGLLIMLGVFLIFGKGDDNIVTAEALITIPFYTMLVGQVVGTVAIIRSSFD